MHGCDKNIIGVFLSKKDYEEILTRKVPIEVINKICFPVIYSLIRMSDKKLII